MFFAITDLTHRAGRSGGPCVGRPGMGRQRTSVEFAEAGERDPRPQGPPHRGRATSGEQLWGEVPCPRLAWACETSMPTKAVGMAPAIFRALRVRHPFLSGPRQTAGVAGTSVPRRCPVRHVGRTCQPLSFGEACRADVEHRRKRRESRAIRTGLWLRIGTLKRTCEY